MYKQTNLDEKQLAKLHTKVWSPRVLTCDGCFSYNGVDLWLDTCIYSDLFLHVQASLKKFMDYIQTSAVDKMAKFMDKGLDPNFQDSDTGGKE